MLLFNFAWGVKMFENITYFIKHWCAFVIWLKFKPKCNWTWISSDFWLLKSAFNYEWVIKLKSSWFSKSASLLIVKALTALPLKYLAIDNTVSMYLCICTFVRTYVYCSLGIHVTRKAFVDATISEICYWETRNHHTKF